MREPKGEIAMKKREKRNFTGNLKQRGSKPTCSMDARGGEEVLGISMMEGIPYGQGKGGLYE